MSARRRRRNDGVQFVLISVAMGLVMALLVAFSIWAWVSAPCGMWKFEKAGEIPSRCLSHYR